MTINQCSREPAVRLMGNLANLLIQLSKVVYLDSRHTMLTVLEKTHFYQRVSIASYANRWYSQRRNVRLSVCPFVCLSVTLRYCIKTKKASVMISSPPESLNILVSRNVWFITKFERGHPERGRFLILGWVRTGDFGNFSTNIPPYLRNGAR